MYVVLIAVTLMLLAGVRYTERRLDDKVAQYKLRFTGEIKNAPPMVAFTTVALGSFRGLVADLLWLRSNSLQQKGNYFEMVQLARWIVDLQPSFSGATAYLAWNMSYNISVTCSDFADRWRWVNEAIKLVRDKALDYNPEDPELYRELSWTYFHKLGNILDDANLYYKNRLAVEMLSVLGTNYPDWKTLAAAPASRREFEKKYPEDHLFWQAMRSAGYETYEDFYTDFRRGNPVQLPKKFLDELGLNNEKLVKDLDNYFRAQLLRDVLKLDPQRIVKQHEKYGAMDWRTPEAHAIYWAELGVEKSPRGEDLKCARIITQALYEAFRSGRLLMVDDKDLENIQVIPNLDLVDSVYNTFWAAQNTYDPDSGAYSTFRSARINFMKEAISILYNYGKFKKAEEYYKKLVAEDGKKPPLEQFVIAEWSERVKNASVKRASEIISGLIFRSINYLIYNDTDAAIAQERMARTIYRNYMKDMGDSERTKLPPYNRMKREVVNACLLNLPPQIAQTLKAKIEAEQTEVKLEKQLLEKKSN